MSKVTVFIINGLPDSGVSTFIKYVSALIPSGTVIRELDTVISVYKHMVLESDNDMNFILELKNLWKRYNNLAFTRFMEHLLDEIGFRETNITNSVIFVIIHDRATINKTLTTLHINGIKAKSILIRRDGVKYPNNSSYYDLSDNYNVIVNNNGSLKGLKRKALAFKRKLITNKTKSYDTIIF